MLSSLKVYCIPSITHRRWSAQSAAADRACRASFSPRWNRFIKPLDCGWCAVVVERVMLMLSAAHREEVNWAPRSEVMIDGTPNRPIQPAKRAFAQAAAVMEARGITSGYLVVLSMMVNRYW